ncbi:MAG TPA: hypothetical protein VKB26_01620 [Candidatus Acidoferrales bacterium]|nr:hypothetical protein [Candidatus Acidoferrales bacterium]
MKQGQCAFEEKIAAASRSGQWNDELLAHVADCHACEEVALVSSYLCESSDAARADDALPNPNLIWSKAQAAAKADAMERALRPILWARRCAFGACAVAVAVAIVLTWSRIGDFFAGFVESWRTNAVSPSAGHGNVLLVVMAVFLLILVPVIFGLYVSWSED